MTRSLKPARGARGVPSVTIRLDKRSEMQKASYSETRGHRANTSGDYFSSCFFTQVSTIIRQVVHSFYLFRSLFPVIWLFQLQQISYLYIIQIRIA